MLDSWCTMNGHDSHSNNIKDHVILIRTAQIIWQSLEDTKPTWWCSWGGQELALAHSLAKGHFIDWCHISQLVHVGRIYMSPPLKVLLESVLSEPVHCQWFSFRQFSQPLLEFYGWQPLALITCAIPQRHHHFDNLWRDERDSTGEVGDMWGVGTTNGS